MPGRGAGPTPHSHAPHVRRLGWYPRGGVLVHVGWEQEDSAMRLSMEQFPAPNRSVREVRRENVSIRIGKDMAWVSFEQIAPKTGDPFDVPGRQHEVRITEKYAGEWKIAACFVIGSALEFVDSPLVRVDEGSAVIWMNAAATDQIKGHNGLTVSGGRLRARTRASNQRLQAAIRWAARLKGYAAFQVVRQVAPTRHGALPVILGDSDELVPKICWVIADSNMILVSFNDRRMIDERLEFGVRCLWHHAGADASRQARHRRPRSRRCRGSPRHQRQYDEDAPAAHVRQDGRQKSAGARPRAPQRRVASRVNLAPGDIFSVVTRTHDNTGPRQALPSSRITQATRFGRPISEVKMLDALLVANAMQRPATPRFTDIDAEDRYYRSHDPSRRLLPLIPLAAIVGVLALVVDFAPR